MMSLFKKKFIQEPKIYYIVLYYIVQLGKLNVLPVLHTIFLGPCSWNYNIAISTQELLQNLVLF